MKGAVEEKRFRKDLFFRIGSFIITLTLCGIKRGHSCSKMENYFMKFCKGRKKEEVITRSSGVDIGVRLAGNIRGLSNVIERAIIVSGDREGDSCQ